MFSLKKICLPVVIVTLIATNVAPAQLTGPVGPATPAGQGLNPEQLAASLRQQGSQVEIRNGNNGVRIVTATIRRDDWAYIVELQFMPSNGGVWLVSPLGPAVPESQKLSANQLFELMKLSDRLGPTHFSFRASDRKLCLNLLVTGSFTEAQLLSTLERFLKDIRESHAAWDISRWNSRSTAPCRRRKD